MLKILNIIPINGQGNATSVMFVVSLAIYVCVYIYIYIYIDTHVDEQLWLAEIDCSLFSQSVLLLLLLRTPKPTK